ACTIADCPPGDVSCQDCNNNGRPDSCDISSHTSQDCNADGIPDECQSLGEVPDWDYDGNGDACNGGIIYVDQDSPGTPARDGTSWEKAFLTLQEGLAAAANRSPGGDNKIVIYVADGS
ncbi:MAG TPA: hypothetical protein PK458_18125, partial [Phycisphaerae bacterium]|nr:hypothetical protein [Phycisphaerae bacterium]